MDPEPNDHHAGREDRHDRLRHRSGVAVPCHPRPSAEHVNHRMIRPRVHRAREDVGEHHRRVRLHLHQRRVRIDRLPETPIPGPADLQRARPERVGREDSYRRLVQCSEHLGGDEPGGRGIDRDRPGIHIELEARPRLVLHDQALTGAAKPVAADR